MNRPHGHYQVDRTNPKALGTCNFCGFIYNHEKLRWNFQWVGPKLQNQRFLVCERCWDVPQEQLRTIILPPDPEPIENARQENYVSDDNPLSGIGYTPNQQASVAPDINPVTILVAYNDTDILALDQYEITSTLLVSEWTMAASAANDAHLVFFAYIDESVFAVTPVPDELNNKNITLTITAKPGTANFAALIFQFSAGTDTSDLDYATVIFNLTTGAVTQTTTRGGVTFSTSAAAAGGGFFTISLTASLRDTDLGILAFEFGPVPTGTPTLSSIGEPVYLSAGASIVVTASPTVYPWYINRGVVRNTGYSGAFIGTMKNLPAAFDSNANKPANQSAILTTVNSSFGNYIGVNWAEAPSTVVPSSLNSPALTHSLTSWSITAPNDATFGSSAYVVQGSNSASLWGTWTTISSGTPAGTVGEIISGTCRGDRYRFHRVAFAENHGQQISVAQVQFNVAQTGEAI